MLIWIANFESNRDGGEKRLRNVNPDIEHQAINSRRGRFAEIQDSPIRIGDAAAGVAP